MASDRFDIAEGSVKICGVREARHATVAAEAGATGVVPIVLHLRTGARDAWQGDTPTRAEIEDLLQGEQMMLDIVFEASIAEVLDEYMTDQRLKDALFGQGVIAAYGGPKDPGTASVKLMHFQGDLLDEGSESASSSTLACTVCSSGSPGTPFRGKGANGWGTLLSTKRYS